MKADVVISGGGPNGLLMACELALAGVRAIVLERLPERSTMPKANGLVGRVIPALDRRGLYQVFSGSDQPPMPAPAFQFGALTLNMSTLDNPSMYILPIPQRRIEEILEQRALEADVDIRRGHEVTALSQNSSGVTIEVNGPDGRYELVADYLVAADGGHSVIRKQLGIEFAGITDTSFGGMMGQVGIAAPMAQPNGELEIPGLGRLKPGTFTRTETGMFAFGMFQPGVYRFGAYEWDRPYVDENAPVSLVEVGECLSRVLGTDIAVTAPAGGEMLLTRRASDGINSRQAVHYREGRVFLVGDAAHVHSGVGGPGLNLGMQDVLNLAWKLAAQVNGWAPEGLLDTYESERHPVGARVIMHTRAQSALLSPGPNITALRQLFEELLRNQDNVQHVADLMAGADVRYDITCDTPCGHPLAGQWMPDLPLRTENGETTVTELMRTGRPVLLDLTGTLAAAAGWSDRVDVVVATAEDAPADGVLIRPDGYVVWAGGADEVQELATALRMWFGAPKAVPAGAQR
ncbi:FAD-dependent monooxygenase [Fodinicola feengrottensis]|uniref:FAD-dependent monooxygenase n=1 Tax=Fodinicola feengrottensis TaxID=435914 RepID=A0ABN2HWG6_9ACTN